MAGRSLHHNTIWDPFTVFLPEFKDHFLKHNALKVSLFAQLYVSLLMNLTIYNTLESSQEMEAE